MSKSKILLQFSVRGEKYGVIKDDRNSAIRYINTVTDKLKQHGALQSLKRQNEDVCVITTDTRKAIVAIKASRHAVYKVRYFVDGNYQKTFESDNTEQLIALVNSRLSIDRTKNSMEDITRLWEQNDNNINKKYVLSIDAGGKQLGYMDILSSIGTEVEPFNKPDLTESCIKSRTKRVSTPGSHCLSCYLWGFLLGPLGIIIATMLTVAHQ